MDLKKVYSNTKETVTKRIKDGSLPKEYELPTLESFVVPSSSSIEKPEYVFVPIGLTLIQWDNLLNKTCNGLWHSSIWKDDLFKISDTKWELWIVSGTDAPNEVNISAEDVDKRDQSLPSAQVYIAQQWQLLENSLDPLDEETWTMAAERTAVSVAGVRWDPYAQRVYLADWGAGDQDDGFGVRGAESGKYLNFDPPAQPSSFNFEITELKINGKTYRLCE